MGFSGVCACVSSMPSACENYRTKPTEPQSHRQQIEKERTDSLGGRVSSIDQIGVLWITNDLVSNPGERLVL